MTVSGKKLTVEAHMITRMTKSLGKGRRSNRSAGTTETDEVMNGGAWQEQRGQIYSLDSSSRELRLSTGIDKSRSYSIPCIDAGCVRYYSVVSAHI